MDLPGKTNPLLFTGNLETRQTRLLTRQCDTCIFGAHCEIYSEDATARLEDEANAEDNFIVCHSTYPPFGIGPAAMCRGFFNRNRKTSIVIKLIRTLFGFEMVDPPAKG